MNEALSIAVKKGEKLLLFVGSSCVSRSAFNQLASKEPRYRKGCCVTSVATAMAAGRTTG